MNDIGSDASILNQSHLLKSSASSKLLVESSGRLEISGEYELKLTMHLNDQNEGIDLLTPVETSLDWILIIYQEFGFYLFRFQCDSDGESLHKFLKERKTASLRCERLIPDSFACQNQELIAIIEKQLADPSFCEYLKKVEDAWDQIYHSEI
eukprot:g3885.t1